MDPLADFTALSPRANEPSPVSRRGETEEGTSQQCSADPAAFAGLQHPHSVVLAPRGARVGGGGGNMRLALDLGGSVSQLSQVGSASQSASQFHDAILQDTQQDEAVTAQGSDDDDDETRNIELAPVEKTSGSGSSRVAARGGFLSTLENRWKSTRTNADSRSKEAELQEDDSAQVIREGVEGGSASNAIDVDESEEGGVDTARREDTEQIDTEPVVGGGDESGWVDEEATPRREDQDWHDAASENGSEQYRRDSMDSIPDTQPLEDEEEETANVLPSTEAFPDTIDEEVCGDRTVDANGARAADATPPITPEAVETTKVAEETSAERAHRFLKRKQKAKNTLTRDPEAFVNTEDQTLTELASRIRRERAMHSAAIGVPSSEKSPLLPSRGPPAIQDDSQEDLTPTQPSIVSPTRVALKKRDKAAQPVAAELSDSQERSYEFIDSSCRCGEAVCQCSGSTPPPKPATRPSSAIRNLEFSFAIPESQDSESQLLDSLPDVGALALKTLEAVRMVEKQGQGSIDAAKPSTKRRSDGDKSPVREADSTPKKAKTSKGSSPSSVARTPPTSRKRGRTFLSPDAGTDPSRVAEMRETPKKVSRNAKPPVVPLTSGNGLSTPSVRTRARVLSPVPTTSSRSYLSRSKTFFKGKFDFCLTGFTGDGQENLTRLIEDYGGKVCTQEVLLKKNNKKVVVIATPVSWRKLKFMYAVACGIPVVHPEWVHTCIKEKEVVSFERYRVPSGCSVITGKFECPPVKELDIFRGLRFGIPSDVNSSELTATKGMSGLIAFILRACGAELVQEDLMPSRENSVDVVLADEFTKVCEYYVRKYQASVKTFAWVTECMILQRCLDPKSVDFSPPQPRSPDAKLRGEVTVLAATAQIGDSDPLKLHTGELLLVDLSAGGKIDHFLLFDVCEILSIRVGTAPSDIKRKSAAGSGKVVKLRVGVLERRPNSPALSRTHTREVDLLPEQVKRRVVAVSKADFEVMQYRDESIFYYEDE